MKAFLKFLTITVFFGGLDLCQAQQTATGQSPVPSPTSYSVMASDANSRVWERTIEEQGPNGQSTSRIERFTELATGLNYQDPTTGQWVPSQEEIDVLPNGTAAATKGQHQAYFPGDIYQGEIRVVTPDGIQLQSRPVGISYDDGTNMVFIAILTNSIGQLLSSNEVIYPNAFEGLNADLIYKYTKAGFEQDVLIRQCPPAPESAGLNPATTRLQVVTEFFDPPQPAVSARPMPNQGGIVLNDESLDFGVMKMMPGRAFLFGTDARDASAWVGKSWVQMEGRQFLVEQVPLNALVDQLAALPAPQITRNGNVFRMIASHKLQLPPQHLAKASPFVHAMQLSRNTFPSKGLVFDYQTLSANTTNYDFQGDTTYYISGNVVLSGTNNIFEGGTVIKYARGDGITLASSAAANWVDGAYRPVIFTAIDDNTVGQTITGSTGSPSGYYANAALDFAGTNISTISHARFTYAQTGVITAAGNSVPWFYDDQFVDCQYAGQFNGSTIYLRNTLFANVQTNFVSLGATNVDVQNATFTGVGSLATVLSGTPKLFLTNCVFANVTNYGPILTNGCYNGFYNSTSFGANTQTATSNPLQTVGGGSSYLTNGSSFHTAGTATIDPTLLVFLEQSTTYPPTVYSNASITTPLTLSPQVQRDTNSSPDLGYHYDPLDYAFGGCTLSTNLNATAGTAIGLFGVSGQPAGILLDNGADVNVTGTATSPCWVAYGNAVQETCNGQWGYTQRPTGFQLNGSGSGEPEINTTFAKLYNGGWQNAIVTDGHARGACNFQNSEFWIGNLVPYDEQYLNFSNCFFFRPALFFFDQSDNPNITIDDCTFYDGFMVIGRNANGHNYGDSLVIVENTAFDGLAFAWGDPLYTNPNDTVQDYNSYNTNNLTWQSYSYPYGPCYGTLETNGTHTLYVTNYNWESSWFGNYYLPTNSPLINAGSTTADRVGLYHFTTQTNQIPETNSVVDIGYHYVATDQYGNPLDSNGDGIPDYLEDTAGNGSGNWDTTLFLNVLITQPQNGSSIP